MPVQSPCALSVCRIVRAHFRSMSNRDVSMAYGDSQYRAWRRWRCGRLRIGTSAKVHFYCAFHISAAKPQLLLRLPFR